jgi:hypothetical protein
MPVECLDRLVAVNGTSMRLLVATCLFLRYATGYYIDGVAPQSFGRGDLYVNLAAILSERQAACLH